MWYGSIIIEAMYLEHATLREALKPLEDVTLRWYVTLVSRSR